MSILDTILLITIAGFVFYGFFYGLIRTFGSLAGIVLGVLFASKYYLVIFNWIDELFFGYDNIGKFLVFLILLSLINRLVCLVFSLLNKTFDVISIIPFLKTINRLSGAILGLLMGIAVVGLVLFVLSTFLGGWFEKISSSSSLMPILLKSAQIIVYFLPTVLGKIKSWMIGWGSSWG